VPIDDVCLTPSCCHQLFAASSRHQSGFTRVPENPVHGGGKAFDVTDGVHEAGAVGQQVSDTANV
jgi:hypothetical protein